MIIKKLIKKFYFLKIKIKIKEHIKIIIWKIKF